jgi:hypothetical protein
MITHIRITPAGALVARLARQHTPNTPRTHDAQGRPVNEPVQCVQCLQAWPCDVRQLLDMILAPA